MSKDAIKLDDLYFGIKRDDFNTKEMNTENLFKSLRVLSSIAIWKTLPEERKAEMDALSFCFGDTRARVEYEFQIGSLWKDKAEKRDVYWLFVEPNRDYLLSLIDKVDVKDCKRFLKWWRNMRSGKSAGGDWRTIES